MSDQSPLTAAPTGAPLTTPPQPAVEPTAAGMPMAHPTSTAQPTPTYAAGPVGKVRSTGTCILLAVVTLGIYSIVWFYKTHSEMKAHSGNGIGGGLALVLTLFVGIVMPFLTSSEVGNLHQRAGRAAPVSGATGLWYFPGTFILVGPIVWFVKTNGALNDHWRSLGAA